MLASWLAQFSGIADEVWFVLSAHNPLKSATAYNLSDLQRLELLNIATEGQEGLKVCDIELTMPRPSYTINTLRALKSKFPHHSFKWVMGADNWLNFSQWKDHQSILQEFGVIVYPRPGYDLNPATLPKGAEWVNAPVVDLSSTFIRNAMAQGKNMSAFLPCGVWPKLLGWPL